MAHPSETFDQARYTALVKERAALEETVETYRQYTRALAEITSNETLLEDRSDPELTQLAEEEIRVLRGRAKELENRLQVLLIPKDPDDEKDVFIEIRAGAGGDEAAIFAGDLARMYMRFAESQGMRVELTSPSESEAGVYKEIIF